MNKNKHITLPAWLALLLLCGLMDAPMPADDVFYIAFYREGHELKLSDYAIRKLRKWHAEPHGFCLLCKELEKYD